MKPVTTAREIERQVLRILTGGERYGFQITKELGPDALPEREGTIYPILHDMVGRGVLQSVWKIEPVKKRPRLYYSIQ